MTHNDTPVPLPRKAAITPFRSIPFLESFDVERGTCSFWYLLIAQIAVFSHILCRVVGTHLGVTCCDAPEAP